MLEFMRRRARSSIIKVLFSIIVLVFIFWGIGGSVSGGRPDVVASINGQTVSYKDFQRAYENVKASYREAYKDRLTPELLKMLDLKGQTLDQLINSRLLVGEAQRVGFSIDDGEIRQAIAAMPVFQTDGKFTQTQYLRVLRFYQASASEFEEEQRARLLSQKLQALINKTSRVTDEEVQELFRLASEKVNLSFVSVASANLVAQVTTDKTAVEEFYNTHRESFRQPEHVRFVYVAYPATHFAPQVQIADQDIAEVYDDNKDSRFTTPERIHARHILFSVSTDAAAEDRAKARETASDILKRARNGEDFATLAKAYSQDTATAPQGGDLGTFAREHGHLLKPFEDAAFKLQAGEVSDLVETQYGFDIIKVEEALPEQARPLAEVKEEIRQELIQERARDLARQRAQEDRSKVQNGTPLAEVAQAAGLTPVDTPLVARDETLADLGRQPALIESAFSLSTQQVSEPVQIQDTWYLLSPQEKAPSAIPDFATVANEAEKRWRSEKAEQLAQEKAKAILARVQETKDLAAVAAQENLKVEATGPFTRQGGYIPKIGSLPDLKTAAFRLTSDAPVVPQTYLWGGNAFVAVLKEQIPPNPQEFDKQKTAIRDELLKRQQDAAVEDLVRYLKQRATITYNQDVLQKIPN
ncbi:MAG: SurA N-terminal domain-containing protein [Deltaproteobacteria bacterium]|nr:SurA N-terminal domain-containing protein [Deltaproteobacteria bacterium]